MGLDTKNKNNNNNRQSEVQIYNGVTGEWVRFGYVSEKLELTPDDSFDDTNIEIPMLGEGLLGEWNVNLDTSTRRLLWAIADYRLATNNWRKLHRLPMLRCRRMKCQR